MNKELSRKSKTVLDSLVCFFSLIGIVLTVFSLVFLKDPNHCSLLGFIIIVFSLNLVIKCRNNPKLFLLFSIIAYINVSVAVLDVFYRGSFSNDYQYLLRHSVYGLTYTKAYTLMLMILDIGISSKYVNRLHHDNEIFRNSADRNVLLSLGFIGVSAIAVFTLFTGNIQNGYVSNSSALYEYVMIFLLLALKYSSGHKGLNLAIIMLSCIYIFQGLLGGDRSSAFMCILMLFVCFFRDKIGTFKMMFLALSGIILANIVAILRQSAGHSENILEVLINRGPLFFFSDTVSASFYTGIVITSYADYNTDNKFILLLKWLLSLVTGTTQETNIVKLASNYMPCGGGGLYPAYFYFFGSYLGVIISTIVLLFIIRNVYIKSSQYMGFLQILIIVYVFRWFLYYPIALYRTIIVNATIIYFASYCIDSIMKRRWKRFRT